MLMIAMAPAVSAVAPPIHQEVRTAHTTLSLGIIKSRQTTKLGLAPSIVYFARHPCQFSLTDVHK